jgi:PKD repeat protein
MNFQQDFGLTKRMRQFAAKGSMFLGCMLMLMIPLRGIAQTSLTPGDIVITGVVATGNSTTSYFNFVTLRVLEAGTVIYFTNNGYGPSAKPTQFRGVAPTNLNGTEDICKFTVNSTIPSGTWVKSYELSSKWSWTTGVSITGTSHEIFDRLTLKNSNTAGNTNNDQICAFQSTTPLDPMFNTGSNLSYIYDFDATKGFEAAASDVTGKAPGTLSAASHTAITMAGPHNNSVYFNPSLVAGIYALKTKTELLNVFSDTSNYVKSNTSANSVLQNQNSQRLNVYAPQPTARFHYENQCGSSVQFTDLSTVASGTINAWYWDFGNDGHSTAQNPVVSYGTPGTYTVTLTVTTDQNKTDVKRKSITVYASPSVNFSTINLCDNGSVSFVNSTTYSGPGTLESYIWDCGDGFQTSQASFTHHYAAVGDYTVKLTAVTSIGCRTTVQHVISVKASPVASFTIGFGGTRTRSFTDGSSTPSGTITSYAWDFGDGNTSTSQSPTHHYINDGLYNVSLTVTNSNGCSNTQTRTVSFATGTSGSVVVLGGNDNSGTPAVNNTLDVSMYPNPVVDNLHIQCNGDKCDQNFNLYVTDMLGRKVKEVNMNASAGFDLNISDLRTGTYIVHVSNGQSTFVQEIVKK